MSWAAKLNLNFSAGSTWTIPFQLFGDENNTTPVAISAVAAKLRKNIDDAAAVATFNCSVVDATNGQGQAVLSSTTTAALTLDSSTDGERDATQFFYDINVTLADGTTVLRILEGSILVTQEATR